MRSAPSPDERTTTFRLRNETTDESSPGTFGMMTWGWYDPDILYALWHSPGACAGCQTPELDAMLEKTRTTIDPDERLKAVQDVVRHLMENAVHVGLYTPGWEWVFATALAAGRVQTRRLVPVGIARGQGRRVTPGCAENPSSKVRILSTPCGR